MILVTGASGQLAALILNQIERSGTRAIGGSRTPSTNQRHIDFDNPDSLDFTGVATLVLISAGYAEDDQVIARHGAAIDAAVRDGVNHIIYTSVTTAGDHLAFAIAHRATEQMIRDSGLAWTILRNGLYAELFGALMLQTPDALISPFGEGRLCAVPRSDLAEAAATIAVAPVEHTGRTYDLTGPAISAADVANEFGLVHHSVPLADYRAQLGHILGLLPFQPPMLMSIASSVRHGFLKESTNDLALLLGRESTGGMIATARALRSPQPS